MSPCPRNAYSQNKDCFDALSSETLDNQRYLIIIFNFVFIANNFEKFNYFMLLSFITYFSQLICFCFSIKLSALYKEVKMAT